MQSYIFHLKCLFQYDLQIEGLLFIRKSSTYQPKDCEDVLWLKLDKLKAVLGLQVPEGLDYAKTNEEDAKNREEQATRKRLRAEREAAAEKEAAEKAAKVEENAGEPQAQES